MPEPSTRLECSVPVPRTRRRTDLSEKSAAPFAQSDNKVHVANMGPTWVLTAPDVPYAGPMNLAIGVYAGSRQRGLEAQTSLFKWQPLPSCILYNCWNFQKQW